MEWLSTAAALLHQDRVGVMWTASDGVGVLDAWKATLLLASWVDVQMVLRTLQSSSTQALLLKALTHDPGKPAQGPTTSYCHGSTSSRLHTHFWGHKLLLVLVFWSQRPTEGCQGLVLHLAGGLVDIEPTEHLCGLGLLSP